MVLDAVWKATNSSRLVIEAAVAGMLMPRL
jgi:hypothetical protein